MSDIFWMGEKGKILEYRTAEELAALQFDAWLDPWLRTWAAIGWLGSTDIPGRDDPHHRCPALEAGQHAR